MRILIATEDRAERELIAATVRARRKAAKLRFASDGVEAYLAARRAAPDLAIVSAGLPRIDGIVLVRTLVRSPAFASWTLLVLGPDCHARVREALEARPSGILVRPFDAPTLNGRLDAILALEKPAPRAAPSRIAPGA